MSTVPHFPPAAFVEAGTERSARFSPSALFLRAMEAVVMGQLALASLVCSDDDVEPAFRGFTDQWTI